MERFHGEGGHERMRLRWSLLTVCLLGVFGSEAAARQVLLQAAQGSAGAAQHDSQDFSAGPDGARTLTAGDRRFVMSPRPIQR